MKRQQDYEHTDSLFTGEQMRGSGQLDMLAQISEMNRERREQEQTGKELHTFVVQATCIAEFDELDGDDQDWYGTIIEPFEIEAENEDKALDYYHETIPVSCLDDWVFSCKRSEP